MVHGAGDTSMERPKEPPQRSLPVGGRIARPKYEGCGRSLALRGLFAKSVSVQMLGCVTSLKA